MRTWTWNWFVRPQGYIQYKPIVYIHVDKPAEWTFGMSMCMASVVTKCKYSFCFLTGQLHRAPLIFEKSKLKTKIQFFISWPITQITFNVFTFYSRWGAGDVIKDPESSDQACSLGRQHIFHILKSRKDTHLKRHIALLSVYGLNSNDRAGRRLSSSDL